MVMGSVGGRGDDDGAAASQLLEAGRTEMYAATWMPLNDGLL